MRAADREWTIGTGDARTSVAYEPAGRGDAPLFVFAHGAGGNMNDRGVRAMTEALGARGIDVVRFNFPYAERRLRRPDPMPRLIAALDAVTAHVRRELAPRQLILGGRSMGGRAASMWVADGAPCDGLLLLAYPLHPPGQPDRLRTGHLPRITAPVLCLNGTRDPFCTPALMEQALAGLGNNWRMTWLDGADHGFHVLKRSGRTDTEVIDEAADAVAGWTGTL